MQRKFERSLASLEHIFSFIRQFTESNALDEGLAFTLNLVVEELFTNMVKYNKGENDIQIELEKQDGKVLVRLIDYDVDAFDITKAEEVDVDQHLEERRVGGLGLHLVKQMMDEIKYEYENENRTSKITLIKHLES